MKSKIASYLEIGNTVFGIEYTTQDSEEVFNVIQLKKSKKRLDIISKDCFNNIKDVAKLICKDKPVTLVINTSDVLIKSIDSTHQDDNKILNEAFPNLNKDEFYFEILKQKRNAFVSICRKEVIDTILKEYQTNRINIVDFIIGNLIISNTLSFLNKTESISLSNTIISLDEKEIQNIKKSNTTESKTYNVNGLDISSNYLLAFSGALKLALNSSLLKSNFNRNHLELKENFKHKRIFRLASRGIITFLLVTLITNFLFFNYYFNQLDHLRNTSEITSSSQEKMTKLADKVLKSKKKVQDVQRLSNSKASYYINEIIISIPESLSLKELNYQPLDKKIQSNKSIESQLGTIEISGKSLDSEFFSSWLTQLENLKWVKIVDIINYETVNKRESNFSIKIKINEKSQA